MSKSDNLYDFFTDLANAIREKEESTAKISPQDMAQRVAALGDKVVVKVERNTLKELLYDIAEALRLVEGSTAPINPQDMSARVLAIIKSYIFNVLEGTIELDQKGSPVSWRVESDTTWSIELNQWDSGEGNLYVTYTGNGNDEPIFSSDPNEGIDREVTVTFKGGGFSVERNVTQEGLRQPFGLINGGVFRIANGGRFGVLKSVVELPYAEELEYLEGDGKQWLDTGFSFDYAKDTEFSAEAMALSDGRTIIMGNYYDANYRCMAIEFGGSSNSHVGAGRGYIMIKKSGALDMWGANANINVKRSISLSFTASNRKAVLTFDGATAKSGTVTAGTISLKNTTRMFLDARATNLSYIQYPLRIYNAQIKQNGELVRDFIPVIDKEGVACMYDKVNGEFYYNKGTGEFIAGHKS